MPQVIYKEKAIIVEVYLEDDRSWPREELLAELRELSLSCDCRVVGEFIAQRRVPDAAYFIGKGKAQEIKQSIARTNADVVILSDELSHAQQRNLENLFEVKVIDRTQLILDIFARRANSQEGKIQVELAQLRYLLPRLAGRGVMLSRLGGGIGTRGPGEQKLEVDRRRIQKRITKLKKDLAAVEARRHTLREKREKSRIPTVALVGYTNSGKSTLLNALTAAGQDQQDKLFATLDPKLKKFRLSNNQAVLIADTVGFLYKLPHHLIESFKATLEEAIYADILVHVLDISNPDTERLKESVFEVLADMEALDKPVITAFNKIDKQPDKDIIDNQLKRTADSVAISALYKKNLEHLGRLIEENLAGRRSLIKKLIPHDNLSLLNTLHKEGYIVKEEYRPDGVYVEARVPKALIRRLGS